jgi:Na+/H+ antiporter NhaA
MEGIFGGVLELANALGGCLLWLLIGRAGWRPSRSARWARIVAGGLPCGIGLTFAYFVLVVYNKGTYDVAGIIVFCFIVSSIVSLAGVALESIRQRIEKGKNDS